MGGGVLNMIISMALLFGLMYFLLIRPQKQRAEETQNMLESLQAGDSVVTIGGLHGVIDEIIEEHNTVILDCEGIYLTFERRAVARITKKVGGQNASNDPQVQEQEVEELGTNVPSSADDDN